VTTELQGSLDGRGLRVGIVAARFNERVVRPMVDGARDALRRVNVRDDDITLVWVPGAFELPLVAARLARSGAVDGIACLGAVIRGETTHHEHVGGQAAAGIARISLDTDTPIAFGVLTADDAAQAEARAGGKAGNKGADAALAVVETIQVLRQVAARGARLVPVTDGEG
jgi:6,7-dimethyl-8-ribityllumazine synthase